MSALPPLLSTPPRAAPVYNGIVTRISRLDRLADGSLLVSYTEETEIAYRFDGVPAARVRRLPRYVTLTVEELARIDPLRVGDRVPFHDSDGRRFEPIPYPVQSGGAGSR
jgi:hypothetical protein